MAGSIVILAALWLALQSMGFLGYSHAISGYKLPLYFNNHPSSFDGITNDIVVDTKYFRAPKLPKINGKALNSSVNFGISVVDRMRRLEENLVTAGIGFTANTPSHNHHVFSSPNEDALEMQTDAIVATKASMYLVQHHCQRYGLSHETCARFVSTLKLEGTSLGDACILSQIVDCQENSTYRSMDGSCNNVANPRWGSALTAYSRILFPRYSDGIQEPRRAERKRKELPSPRIVSTSLSRPTEISEISATLSVMQWSQFIAHDIANTPVRKMVTNGKPISCCGSDGSWLSPRYIHPDCAAIRVPDKDPIYGNHYVNCMNYVRSLPVMRQDCSFGPVEQMNQVSHFLDGSTVYGSTLTHARQLRTFENGKLLIETRANLNYLPAADVELFGPCNETGKCYKAGLRRKGIQSNKRFIGISKQFLYRYITIYSVSTTSKPYKSRKKRNVAANGTVAETGDDRVNFEPSLAVMHTVWHREHNRIATKLHELNPLWSDEVVYQETRRIVVAKIQHITYNEWLPIVLGKVYTESIGLSMKSERNTQYNSYEDPSVSNEAATAVLRFLNSLKQGKLSLPDESRRSNRTLQLSEHFYMPRVIENDKIFDGLIRGLATQTSSRMDINLVPDITHRLHRTNSKLGLDAISLDIQQGRDHGLSGYNYYREYCGLPLAKKFEDFLDHIPLETVRKMETLYDQPNDVDLVIGGMAERHVDGSILGPTFRCLLSEQLARSRWTDRYFYDSANQPHPFTSEQLNQLRRVTLTRIFCDNGNNISRMQPNVFKRPQVGNNLASCDDFQAIPSVDLYAWVEKAKAYR